MVKKTSSTVSSPCAQFNIHVYTWIQPRSERPRSLWFLHMDPNICSSGYFAHLSLMHHLLFINLDVPCTSVTVPKAANYVSAATLEEFFVSEEVCDVFGLSLSSGFYLVNTVHGNWKHFFMLPIIHNTV